MAPAGMPATVRAAAGALLLGLSAPFVVPVLLGALLWEAADRRGRGGLWQSNQELTGWLFRRALPTIDRVTAPWHANFVRRPSDAFMVNCVALHGVGVPLAFGVQFACDGVRLNFT